MKMQTQQVAAKVVASSVAALLTPIVLALLAKGLAAIGLADALPDDAGELVAIVVLAACSGAGALAAGYFRRPNPEDKPVVDTTA